MIDSCKKEFIDGRCKLHAFQCIDPLKYFFPLSDSLHMLILRLRLRLQTTTLFCPHGSGRK
jgi:hypothetical protein